jgi:hypothetical protein
MTDRYSPNAIAHRIFDVLQDGDEGTSKLSGKRLQNTLAALAIVFSAMLAGGDQDLAVKIGDKISKLMRAITAEVGN